MILDASHRRGRREFRILLWDMAIVALWACTMTATAPWAVTLGPMQRSWRGIDAHTNHERRR